ncbi:DUF1569 domain-containing protein [Mucilaginibacter sp. dw_454]|uniref:DUF1569 domain-containing protein n=1 Tax=Mucilaginibacter sp. dw_454 TaxID=2720079 RepID=UPI001BD271C7|nr:DUF1569 domain-containing protein [Mucilaginibacter sp. dw_454]
MELITDKLIADQLINRINLLQQDTKPQWGKMNVYQMLKHLTMWEEMAMNKTLYKQAFLGRLIGKFALKDMLKEGPLKQSMPTVPSFKMSGDGDIGPEKSKLIDLIKAHIDYPKGFLHPFFGKLTAEEASRMAYKHADHHLHQFGV